MDFNPSGVGMGRAPFCCETWKRESLWHIMNHEQGSDFKHVRFSASITLKPMMIVSIINVTVGMMKILPLLLIASICSKRWCNCLYVL
eukprot:g17714.t1